MISGEGGGCFQVAATTAAATARMATVKVVVKVVAKAAATSNKHLYNILR